MANHLILLVSRNSKLTDAPNTDLFSPSDAKPAIRKYL